MDTSGVVEDPGKGPDPEVSIGSSIIVSSGPGDPPGDSGDQPGVGYGGP